jgi:hypothetical protein
MASANLVRSIYAAWGGAAIKTVRTLLSLDGLVGSLCDERLGPTKTAALVRPLVTQGRSTRDPPH